MILDSDGKLGDLKKDQEMRSRPLVTGDDSRCITYAVKVSKDDCVKDPSKTPQKGIIDGVRAELKMRGIKLPSERQLVKKGWHVQSR